MQDARIQLLWQLDPEWGHAAWRASPDRIERVLHIHLGTPEEPQTSLCQALASLAGAHGYRRVDWTALSQADLHQALLEASATLRPTLVFMQLQRPGILSAGILAEMRRAARIDDLVIASWCGDVGGTNGPFRTPGDRWAYDLSLQCDLMLYTSMSQARAHRSNGMHNAGYLQIGYDEHRYFEGQDSEHGSRFDVAFLGINYDDREWTSLPGHEAGLRRAVVEVMRRELGARLGLFGRAWGWGVTHLPPAQSGDVYRSSRLALNISICSFLERYSSDRLLRALACGTPVLLKAFDDWSSLGLIHGENVLVWNTVDEVMGLVRTWLDPARRAELREIGRRGATLAREHHSWGVRMQELCPLVAAARSTRLEVTRPW
jgi:hypothetical protein